MYAIDLGNPKPRPPSIYQINPNKNAHWSPSDEVFTLSPKSNELATKWEVDQKQQLKIFPHMFSGQSELVKQHNKPWKGGIERGGVDYPIPMRFQLRYLQQPPPLNGSVNDRVDYEARPVYDYADSNAVPRRDYNERYADSQFLEIAQDEPRTYNTQRGIIEGSQADFENQFMMKTT